VNKFQLDIITPTSITSYNDISYLRVPSLDGLTGVQAKHAPAIIALTIGEIKITIDGKDKYFSTSGGFSDIKSEGVQLLLETIEDKDDLNKERAKKALDRAQKRFEDKSMNIDRAQQAMLRAKNRLNLFNK
jgi:F-type H+-transporting ATPase subunit epsilon